MKIDLNKIDEIVKLIAGNYNPSKIYLFGSYSKGNISENSDIDLLIVKETTEKINKRGIQVYNLLRNYKFDFDIVVYTPDEFNQMKNFINTLPYFVNNTGKLMYEA
ncbi:MAG: hypothetical protein A2046_02210 [Bacteroidetes bacterium GWA2_30_7]|nr:MAG: hypothetical protein A2046_02210 [Bacteroidetes bacterium GWA2_30_7]